MAQVGGGGHRFEGGCRYAKERFGGRDEERMKVWREASLVWKELVKVWMG